MFHKHKWIVLDKQVFESPYDVAVKNGIQVKSWGGGISDFSFFNKQVVVHYKCETCGTERVTR